MASTVTLGGNPIDVAGNFPQAGQTAPAFSLVGADLADVPLKQFSATSVRNFNKRASDLPDMVVLCISVDLPFAQKRFCGAEGLNNVITLSTMRGREFLKDYGVEIASGPLTGLAARAVVVLDAQNRVLYTELVPEIKNEPNYDAAIKALA